MAGGDLQAGGWTFASSLAWLVVVVDLLSAVANIALSFALNDGFPYLGKGFTGVFRDSGFDLAVGQLVRAALVALLLKACQSYEQRRVWEGARNRARSHSEALDDLAAGDDESKAGDDGDTKGSSSSLPSSSSSSSSSYSSSHLTSQPVHEAPELTCCVNPFAVEHCDVQGGFNFWMLLLFAILAYLGAKCASFRYLGPSSSASSPSPVEGSDAYRYTTAALLGVATAAGLVQFIVLFLWGQRSATGFFLRTYGPGVARGDKSAASLVANGGSGGGDKGGTGEGEDGEKKSDELTASVRATFARLVGLAYPERCLLIAVGLHGVCILLLIEGFSHTHALSPTRALGRTRTRIHQGTIALFGSSTMQMISPMLFGKLTQIVSPTAFCKAGDASKSS